METGARSKDPRIELYWAKYSDTLKLFCIPERLILWYRRHIQVFINDRSNIRLKEHSVESLELWLGNLGRNHQISDWQFSQKSNALRLLFYHFFKLRWASDIDRDLWLSSAKHLGNNHPDIYRKHLVSMKIPDYSPNTEKSSLS